MYKTWQKNPKQFLALTGYTEDVFLELLPYFSNAHKGYFERYELDGSRRKGGKKYVIYKNSPLATIEDRLVFILSYKKLNPIQEQQAAMFSMTQKQCYLFVHALSEVLEEALKWACVMPAQSKQELKEVLAEQQLLLHDGSEREIPRPVDNELQQENYSGKKKKHTVKNVVITTAVCFILFVSATVSGSVHDKKIAEHCYADVLANHQGHIELWQDTGFQGFAPVGVKIVQPMKKPRGKELSQVQKDNNRAISSVRVRVEHAIGSTKRYRIVKDECRLRKNDYPQKVFVICAGLHNFRIQRMPFQYPEFKLT